VEETSHQRNARRSECDQVLRSREKKRNIRLGTEKTKRPRGEGGNLRKGREIRRDQEPVAKKYTALINEPIEDSHI